ncbi:hypothetical protein A2U01_0117025, partial [Trifolium medium]|nr:hypothetical protein [Trifolium medium]
RIGRDVLEAECSRFSDVCSEPNELEQQVVGTTRGEVARPSVHRGSVSEIG